MKGNNLIMLILLFFMLKKLSGMNLAGGATALAGGAAGANEQTPAEGEDKDKEAQEGEEGEDGGGNKDKPILDLDKEKSYFEKKMSKDGFIEDRKREITTIENQIYGLKVSLDAKLEQLGDIVNSTLLQQRAYKISADSLNFL